MTRQIGIAWEGFDADIRPASLRQGAVAHDDDALPRRIHAAPGSFGFFEDADDFSDEPRPSLWSRVKAWAENFFADPEGDDE
jgi:hypothetical protein